MLTLETITVGQVEVSTTKPNTTRFDTPVISPGRFGSGTDRAVTIDQILLRSLSAFVAGGGVTA